MAAAAAAAEVREHRGATRTTAGRGAQPCVAERRGTAGGGAGAATSVACVAYATASFASSSWSQQQGLSLIEEAKWRETDAVTSPLSCSRLSRRRGIEIMFVVVLMKTTTTTTTTKPFSPKQVWIVILMKPMPRIDIQARFLQTNPVPRRTIDREMEISGSLQKWVEGTGQSMCIVKFTSLEWGFFFHFGCKLCVYVDLEEGFNLESLMCDGILVLEHYLFMIHYIFLGT
jgi:hypothetical protein